MVSSEAAENVNFILLSSTTDLLVRYKQSNSFRIIQLDMLG